MGAQKFAQNEEQAAAAAEAEAESESVAVAEGEQEKEKEEEDVWETMRAEAEAMAASEPALASYLHAAVLQHGSLEGALACHVASKLWAGTTPPPLPLCVLSGELLSALSDAETAAAVRADMRAFRTRDAACGSYVEGILNYKGFQALTVHRLSHRLWRCGRPAFAAAVHALACHVLGVDIHPGAQIGRGVLLDHGTCVVIGETAVVGDDVSILHGVTLGGNGKDAGRDRHPKVGNGVLIGAGATILGNVSVGDGAKIGAGAVVLTDVPARTTAIGNPARLVGGRRNPTTLPSLARYPSFTMDHTSYISDWSDYVI